MASVSIIARNLKCNGMHIDRTEECVETVTRNGESFERSSVKIHARPFARLQGKCPICMKDCPTYDHQNKTEVQWRANSFNGVPHYICYKRKRIECSEHGVKSEYVPWAQGSSRFTAGFSDEVAFLALNCPKTVVCEFFDIDWRSVGECIKNSHDRIEPDVTVRLEGLKRICVDETSYRKGHSYITVVVDMDRNQVVWISKDHGREVFERFCTTLTEDQRKETLVVAGDGARWINDCTREYFPNAKRCMDFFHVVTWLIEILDKMRNAHRNRAVRELKQMTEEFEKAQKQEKAERERLLRELENARKELASLPRRGRPSNRKKELEAYITEIEHTLEDHEDNCVSIETYTAALEELKDMPRRGRRSKRKAELLTLIALYEKQQGGDKTQELSAVHKDLLNDIREKIKLLKGVKYAVGMNPENLRESALDKLELLKEQCTDLYKAYQFKEELRIITHMKDLKTAKIALEKWMQEAKVWNNEYFNEMVEKIDRNKEFILNAIEMQANSSQSEATNTTIKALIRVARGFKNLDNLFALIYLKCSSLSIPLNNRYQKSPETQARLRRIQRERKQAREQAKVEAYKKTV